MAFLTDRTLANSVTTNDLIHIVITGDTSQNPAGSSFKATIGQVTDLVNSVIITGGTYNSSTGEITFSNSSGGTFTVSGFVTGFTDSYVSGGTYSAGTAIFTNTTGGTFSVSGFTEPFSGGSGNCITDFYVTNVFGCSPITFHSEIQNLGSTANGLLSVSFGNSTVADGDYSHAEGDGSNTTGFYSHAEGQLTIANGQFAHAEGKNTTADGDGSHAEGTSTQAIGGGSHAEGNGTQSIGEGSHAEGLGTIALGDYQHVQGQYNLTSSTQSAFIIGNGGGDFSRRNLVYAEGTEFQIDGDLFLSGIFYNTGATHFISTTAITSTTFTLTAGKTYYGVDYSGNTDLTLPNPTNLDGLKIIVKDEGGYSGSYRIRLTSPIGMVDGNSYVDMNINYMSLTLVARNNNWWII